MPAPRTAPVAAIDLGSNTVRLLVASVQDRGLKRHFVTQEATRLGQALKPGQPLNPEAAARTRTTLGRFARLARSLEAEEILVGATMAVREASDGRDFLSLVERELGCRTWLLTGQEEAELTLAGVLTALNPVPESALIFDLGGRSTEFILAGFGRMERAVSLELGAVALTESRLLHDPPRDEEMTALRDEAAAALSRGLADLAVGLGASTLVGTAGTATTLAAMAQKMTEYHPELIDNYRLERTTLEKLLEKMRGLPSAGRASLPGLPADRADIIVAGTVVVLEIMNFFSARELIVTDAGLLEGLGLAAASSRSVHYVG
ncbi:MAG: hypothetical protein AB1641_29085 [Thermodesulfobacteriota bacterium]